MTILVMGQSSDEHAVHMVDALKNAGADVALFDTSLFPTQTSINWVPQQFNGTLTLPDGHDIALSDIKSVYWRTINKIKLPETNQEATFLANRDCMSTLRTLFRGTPARWVNSWENFEHHKEKPLQLATAHQLGITIPESLISNNAQQIIEFVGRLGKAIYKPVYGGAHTDFVSPQMLQLERLKKVLAISPVTIQAFIEGTNIRTYVIGDKIFSAEIRSGAVDFRQDSNHELIPMDLPEEITRQSFAVTQAFDMQWTAIDWRRDNSGVYHFLEANPSPMFIHFERVTGLPITQTLVELMMD
jgi:glutathione synthase/RimK-type ligase-like ATP-grasp enzyme